MSPNIREGKKTPPEEAVESPICGSTARGGPRSRGVRELCPRRGLPELLPEHMGFRWQGGRGHGLTCSAGVVREGPGSVPALRTSFSLLSF